MDRSQVSDNQFPGKKKSGAELFVGEKVFKSYKLHPPGAKELVPTKFHPFRQLLF